MVTITAVIRGVDILNNYKSFTFTLGKLNSDNNLRNREPSQDLYTIHPPVNIQYGDIISFQVKNVLYKKLKHGILENLKISILDNNFNEINIDDNFTIHLVLYIK